MSNTGHNRENRAPIKPIKPPRKIRAPPQKKGKIRKAPPPPPPPPPSSSPPINNNTNSVHVTKYPISPPYNSYNISKKTKRDLIFKVLDKKNEEISTPIILYTPTKIKSSKTSKTSKPSIPQYSHYHLYMKQHRNSDSDSYSLSSSNISTQSQSSSTSISATNSFNNIYDINIMDHSLNGNNNDNNDNDNKEDYKQDYKQYNMKIKSKRLNLKQRKYSDIYSAFSLKRTRFDSSLSSKHKLSISDQYLLEKQEWELMNALKTHNKDIIINSLKSVKIQVLSNFLPFIGLMLTNNVYNIYNIHQIKDEIILTLFDIIKRNIDLQQQLSFILSSYPSINKIFKSKNINIENNAVKFWNKIINFDNIYEGYNFKIEKNNDKFRKYVEKIVDPIIVNKNHIKLVAIKKILTSNAKPLLLDIYINDDKEKEIKHVTYSYNKLCQNGILSSSIILKKGDDLRKDYSIMMVFKFMNQLWKQKNIHYNGKIVNILTYSVIPISKSLGIIEVIPNCIGLKEINSIKKDLEIDDNLYINNLISSSAAAYISCLIMGIRDRHWDNQMIRKIDYKLFHIDHQFIFGEKASIDASELGITKSLANIMGNKYKVFVELAIEAHSVLRSFSKELIDFTTMAFSNLYQPKIIHQYISKKLRLKLNDDKAKNWLRKKLLKAPKNQQTRFKNQIHQIAVNLSSNNYDKDWD